MIGLPYGEEIMIVGRTMWTQCTSVTDGRTELRSQRPCNAERRTVKTANRHFQQFPHTLTQAEMFDQKLMSTSAPDTLISAAVRTIPELISAKAGTSTHVLNKLD